MPNKKVKTVKKKRTRDAWDSLIVGRVESLPKDVFILFVARAKSPNAAAQRKAADAGVPGRVTVVQQHPLNRTTGKALFQDIMSSLKHFPYGDSDCLVKATAPSISRKYSKLSSQDPNQIELRKQIFEQQVEEQLALLDEIKKRHDSLAAATAKNRKELEELEYKKASLVESISEVEKEFREKRDELDSANEQWGDRSMLEEEVEELRSRIAEIGLEFK